MFNNPSLQPKINDNFDGLYKKGIALEYFTIGYNVVEAAASIFFGAMGGSIAMVGFGLGANYLFGFSTADPIAGLVIVVFLVREGVEAWSEAQGETGDEKSGGVND